jgi:hypothetical protein
LAGTSLLWRKTSTRPDVAAWEQALPPLAALPAPQSLMALFLGMHETAASFV